MFSRIYYRSPPRAGSFLNFDDLITNQIRRTTLLHPRLRAKETITDLEPVDIPTGIADLPPRPGALLNPQQEILLKEGVTAIGRPLTPIRPAGVSPEMLDEVIGDLRRPDSEVTGVKTPEGFEFSATPAVADSTLGTTPKAGEFVGGGGKGIWDRIGSFIRDPRFSYLTAEAAKAIAPYSPGIQQIGGVASNLAVNRAVQNYERVLEEGGDLTDPQFDIIPNELRQQAVQAKLEGRKLDIQEQYMGALGEQARATAAGVVPAETKVELENQANATRLELGRMRNNWMNIGQGHVLDIRTGDVTKAYDYKTGTGGSAVGNLNSSDYRLFNEYTTATFLPLAMENRRAELVKTQGESAAKLVDLIGEFKNDDGSTNFQALMKYLSEEQRVEFAGQLNEYTTNIGRGIPPTGTFLQQQMEANTVQTPDGKTWRIMPDGSYVEVK